MQTAEQMWYDALQRIRLDGIDLPSRDGDCREIQGYVGRIERPQARFIFDPVRRMSPSYAAAEVLWYLSGADDIRMIKAYAPQYERFANDNRAWGSYGARWVGDTKYEQELYNLTHQGKLKLDHNSFFTDEHHPVMQCPISQIAFAAWLLKKKPETRQCIVTCWNAGDLPHAMVGDKKDIPCTLTLNFLLRQNELNLIVTMRSNDVWLGMPYDVFGFTCIQQIIAESIGVNVGWYQHQAASMHLYARNKEKAEQVVPAKTGTAMTFRKMDDVKSEITHGLFMEKSFRNGQFETTQCGSTLLRQLAAMAGTRWSKKLVEEIKDPLLREYCIANPRGK